MQLVFTVLLIFICFILSRSQGIEYKALSSNVTFNFGPCELNKVYKIHIDDVTILSPCNSSPQIPDRFEGRIIINKTTGTITLCNVIRSDAGYYRLERTNGNGKKENLPGVEIRILDPVLILELYRNDTERTISFTVRCVEVPGAFNWTVDGRDMPNQRWQSTDNRTLTIPYNYTGVITVSNLVNGESISITLIRDLNGKHDHCDHIMHLNITKEIWGECEGHTGDETLILPRNITNKCVLIPSDKTDEPHSRGYRSHDHFGLISIPVVILFSIILLAVLWKKTSPKMEVRLENDDGVIAGDAATESCEDQSQGTRVYVGRDLSIN
ncbi:uncharacterized protein [Phyllobates terribilis]|uniref:uncharacterized protein n=1 Tax=Phyllobates terribilis TaxID=111132 RepID=UPI003CCB731B